MKKTLYLAPLFLLLAGAGPSTGDEAIAYAPANETTLTRTSDSDGEYALDRVVILMGDQEIVVDEDSEGWSGLDITFTEDLVLVDEIQEVGDGQPTKLLRTFESLGQLAVYEPGEGEGSEIEYVSDLQGTTVVIAWDDEDGEYTFSPAEDQEIDSDLLELLDEDTDLRGFLPDGEVAVDDSWEIGLEAYMPLSWFGGDLSFYSDEEDTDENMEALSAALREATEAEGTATFKGVRDEDGVRVAVIAFDFESTAEAEVEADVELEEPVEGVYLGREVEGNMEGELLWDIENGHAHSLTATTETTIGLIERIAISYEGEELEQIQKQILVGEGTQTVTIER